MGDELSVDECGVGETHIAVVHHSVVPLDRHRTIVAIHLTDRAIYQGVRAGDVTATIIDFGASIVGLIADPVGRSSDFLDNLIGSILSEVASRNSHCAASCLLR